MSYTIPDIISPQLAEFCNIKPLEGNETAEFKLVNAGIKDNLTSNGVSTPQAYVLPGQETITDNLGKIKQEKMIINISGFEPVPGKKGEAVILSPIIDWVRFPSTGRIYLTGNDTNLLFYLRLYNKNGSNPNRKISKPIRFEEVNEAKELSLKNNFFEYRTLASMIILNADNNEEQLVNMATKFTRANPTLHRLDITLEVSRLKAGLSVVAEKYPVEFILAIKENDSYARVLVDDAVIRKQIFFNDHSEKMTWEWKRAFKETGKKIIIKLSSDKNKVKQLVNFLQTGEGHEHFMELKARSEEFYRKSR